MIGEADIFLGGGEGLVGKLILFYVLREFRVWGNLKFHR